MGDAGTILHFNGEGWRQIATETTDDLYWIEGDASGTLFTVSTLGLTLIREGDTWQDIGWHADRIAGCCADSCPLVAIFGYTPNDVYAWQPTFCDDNSHDLIHFDGDIWTELDWTDGKSYFGLLKHPESGDIYSIGDTGSQGIISLITCD